MTFITDLDNALSGNGDEQAGTPVTIMRRVSGREVTVETLAAERLVNKPDPNAAGSNQDEHRFIISMTDIIAQNWPGTGIQGAGFRARDTSVPTRGDTVFSGGVPYHVEGVNAIRIAGVVVRVEIFAKGNVGGA